HIHPFPTRRSSDLGGKLFPNTELGHLGLGGMDAEKWASARVRTAENLDFPAWIERVNDYLAEMHRLFWPDVFILGGAVSERFAEFAPLLRSPAELRPAQFTGQAGVVGAALAAAESRGAARDRQAPPGRHDDPHRHVAARPRARCAQP